MTEQVQKFSYRDSPYLRPTQKWVCGHLAEGTPCQIGPDNGGNCRATSECRPRQDGSRWHCTRSQLAGGPCKEGPLPSGDCCRIIPKCRPVRSWRAKRVATTKWLLSAMVGLLLLCLAGAGSLTFISPGSLTSKHAQLSDCSTCHSASEFSPTRWLHTAFLDPKAKEDSKLCLTCHQLGDDAFQAHTIPAGELSLSKDAKLSPSSGVLSVRIANAFLQTPMEGRRTLTCGTCHSEHHGSDFDLTAMSDDGCSTCHKEQFKSFSAGHPVFTNYPYQSRTDIQFDHVSHFGKHFQDEKNKLHAPKECQNCHKLDAAGELMLVKSFDNVCGTCHGGQVEGTEGRSGAKGIAVLNIPGIDIYTLQDREASIGTWPEYAEGPVTPFMDLLLSSNENYRNVKAVLQGVDLMDLSDATDEQIGAVGDLVWNVKGLFHDVRINGLKEIKTRIEKAFGQELTTDELAQLTGLLPSGVVQTAQSSWFPDLFTEILRHRNGERIVPPSQGEPQHEVSTDLSALKESEDASFKDDEIDFGEDDEIDFGEDDEIDLGEDDEIDLGEDDEIDLGEDDEIDLGEDDEIGLGDDDEIDLGDDDEIDLGDDDEIADEESEKNGLDGHGNTNAPKTPVIDEEWASAGGWYQDDDYFALRYRPVGHADIFVQSWLDLTGPLTYEGDKPQFEAVNKIFETLTDPKGPGVCTKCHSIDQNDKAAAVINWGNQDVQLSPRSFTKYSHEPHLSLLDAKGCTTCHSIDAESDYSASFTDRNPNTFASNFKPMEQAICVDCHQPRKASDSCLTCHNYHAAEFAQVQTATEMLLPQED